MQTIDRFATTLDKAHEIDNLEDVYIVARRIPQRDGALLYAYETEMLIPLSQLISKPKGSK
jgi:hypothetical protein